MSYFSSYTSGGSKFISSTTTPKGPTAFVPPTLPAKGSTFTVVGGTQKSMSGPRPIFGSGGGGGSSPAPPVRQPTQTLSMGVYDPNTKTFVDKTGNRFSTTQPQQFNMQLVAAQQEQQKVVRQQTAVQKQRQIVEASKGPFTEAVKDSSPGPFVQQSGRGIIREPSRAEETASRLNLQRIRDSQTGFADGTAFVGPGEQRDVGRVEEAKRVRRDIVEVGEARRSKEFVEARREADRFLAFTGTRLSGDVDPVQKEKFESLERAREIVDPIVKQKTLALAKEQERFLEFEKARDENFESVVGEDQAFFSKWKARDLEPGTDTLVLSETDFQDYSRERSVLDSRIAGVGVLEGEYSKRFERIKAKEDKVVGFVDRVDAGFSGWNERVEALASKEAGLSDYQKVAVESFGYGIKPFEFDYSPVQQKRTGDLAGVVGLFADTVSGKVPSYDIPVPGDVEGLKAFAGKTAFEEKVFRPFDFAASSKRVGESTVALAGIGGFLGSGLGSSIPVLGTGIGFVAGSTVGAKAGFVAGVADVVASETVGRVTGSDDWGGKAGFVAGLTGAGLASSIFMGKEVAKRTVSSVVSPPKVVASRTISLEVVPKKGLARGGDVKVAKTFTKQTFSVDVAANLKPDTSKLNVFVQKIVSGVTKKPVVSQTKFLGSKNLVFDVVSEGKSATVLTGSKFSRVAVDGVGRTDLVVGGTKDFFVSGGKTQNIFVQKGTLGERLTGLFVKKPGKSFSTGFDRFIFPVVEYKKGLGGKIFSKVRGEKFVVSKFKERGVSETLGFRELVESGKARLTDYVDRVATTSMGPTPVATRIAVDPNVFVGKAWIGGKSNLVDFLGRYTKTSFKPGFQQTGFVKDVPFELIVPQKVSLLGAGGQTQVFSKSMTLQQASDLVGGFGIEKAKTFGQASVLTAKSISGKNLQTVQRLAKQTVKQDFGKAITMASDVSSVSTRAFSPIGAARTRTLGLTRLDYKPVDVFKTVDVEKLRTGGVADTKFSTDYLNVFARPDTRADLVSGIERLRSGFGVVPRVGFTQTVVTTQPVVEKIVTLPKVVEKIRVRPGDKIDFVGRSITPFVPRVLIPITTVGGGVPGFGRMDSGGGVGRFKRVSRGKKSVPLFQVKSDLFRKFATGERDLRVSRDNVRLIKSIRGRKGSLLGFVPTKELLGKKKRRGGKWFDDEDSLLKGFGFGFSGVAL